MAILRDETQAERHLERPSRLLSTTPAAEAQRKRMLIALGILLLALGAVIIKDWDFWFPTHGETAAVNARKAKMLAQESENAPAAPVHERRSGKTAEAEQPAEPAAMSAKTERAVLPPLQVEVVAGNQRLAVAGKNAAVSVDVGGGGTTAQTTSIGAPGQVRISPQIQQSVNVTVPPDYPLLARQMKVQGVVTLQALIARDGTIQELQILSGPDILATAARDAVKQWHFKPYLQNGQPVETQAKITVNFTISTN